MVQQVDLADGKDGINRFRAEIGGFVQGVGFRPHVYRLARSYGLSGWVRNSGQGVTLELEGTGCSISGFFQELSASPPRLAQITGIVTRQIPPVGDPAFAILPSSPGEAQNALISPDVAACEDCRREVMNPADRRYRYPFTNCTNCGPRFTIVRGVPYDREQTTMRSFEMCEDCCREYHDPADRRFHAQPNACPRCGPQVSLVDKGGKEIPGEWAANFRQLMQKGCIIAVKGLGGFHLVCDAQSDQAITELRQRKHRPCKPLAVMCRDLAVVRLYCRVSREEANLLTSPAAPIVILERKAGCILPETLAPHTGTLGVMLPYTPLHLLLFDKDLAILVMTSGNVSDLPLVKDNVAALEQLGGIANYFLLHNREIRHRCDDSLMRVVSGQPYFFRRSRGFTPRPVQVPPSLSGRTVLGIGAEMKNAFCLLSSGQAFISQHLGEMNVREGITYFRESLESLQALLSLRPQVVAYDPHPGYRISALARELPAELRVPVQHHHAHMAACMAENGLDRPVIGVICDGTGYGTDGCVWGFEVLAGGYQVFERSYHLSYLPMPGGEQAVRQPWRMAVAYLDHYLGQEGLELAAELFPGRERKVALLAQMLRQHLNAPLTSSCGRLFDAVAALLGVCGENTYEGQAAVELGELVDPRVRGHYPFLVADGVIDPTDVIKGIVRDLRSGAAPGVISTRFHNSVIAIVIAAVTQTRTQTGLEQVVLSGGVWQNWYLLLGVTRGLRQKGFQVYTHREVPANDGGIALGQAVVADRQAREFL